MIQEFFDIVITGPDMSGTSTQVQDFINYFKNKGKKVRDIRGTEIDLLFHAQVFEDYNKNFVSLKEFLDSEQVPQEKKYKLLLEIYSLVSGYKKDFDLMVGSFKKNKITTFIDPNSADVWIMEEPTKRGAGQVSRVIEQNRSFYDFKNINDGFSAAISHQSYRQDEFYRIRKILRENNKIIIRSRSEESACYQIYDKKNNINGIKLKEYLSLPGHKIAFKFPPTHIFVVCGPKNWNKQKYLELKEKRSQGRILDDLEINADYQIMVNKRYAGKWINKLYENGCEKNNCEYLPTIYRFNIYDSKEIVKTKMYKKLNEIIKF